MIRISLFISALLIGLSMVLAKDDFEYRNIRQKQYSHNKEQIRTLRNLMGKLIDTETNTIYTVDGQKQQEITTTTQAPAPAPLNHEEIACLAACHSCLESYSLENRKKKAADNCGPMCDCADSCFLMSVEEVGKIYGPYSHTRNNKNCWWTTYTEMLANGLP